MSAVDIKSVEFLTSIPIEKSYSYNSFVLYIYINNLTLAPVPKCFDYFRLDYLTKRDDFCYRSLRNKEETHTLHSV